MHRRNIEPWLTLYRLELPQALQDKSSWLNPFIVEAFDDYAALVAKQFPHAEWKHTVLYA